MWNEQELHIIMSVIAYSEGKWTPEQVAEMFKYLKTNLTIPTNATITSIHSVATTNH